MTPEPAPPRPAPRARPDGEDLVMMLKPLGIVGALLVAASAALMLAGGGGQHTPRRVASVDSVCPRADVLDAASLATARSYAAARQFLDDQARSAPDDQQTMSVSFLRPENLQEFLG